MAEPLLKFASDTSVADGVITALLSTEAVDRDGDIVRASGWDLSNFQKAPRLMSCHDYGRLTSQIGEWRNVHVDPVRKALVGEAHYYVNQGNPEADWGYYLASIGQATYSVGFNPKEWEPRKGSHTGQIFTQQELLEASHVPIPSNAEALQLMAKAFRARQPGETRIVQKAGRVVSSANMAKLHQALGALHDVHDATCTDEECPIGSEPDADDTPIADRDKAVTRAMGEGDGAAGGVTVSDSGTHGAYDGKHSHPHDGQGVQEDGDGLHEHGHAHDGDGNHGHSHDGVNFKTARERLEKSHSELPDSAFACISPGGTKEDGKTRPLSLRHYPHHTAGGGVDPALLRAALSRIGDSSNEQCGKAHLESHARDEGMGDRGPDKAYDLMAALEAALADVEL